MAHIIKLTKRFCVYADLTNEDVPRWFYVGKGTEDRVNLFVRRNQVHQRITAKYGMHRIVVSETDDEQQALRDEVRLIAEHKTFTQGGEGWWGANLTLGGEGTSGHVASMEQRHNQSIAIKAAHRRDPSLAQAISTRQIRLMSEPTHVKKVSDGIKAAFASMPKDKRQKMRVAQAEANKGRVSPVRGSNSPRTTLTEDNVHSLKSEFLRIMRHGIERGVRGPFIMTCAALAQRFQVSWQTVAKIVRGQTWNHIRVEYHGECI